MGQIRGENMAQYIYGKNVVTQRIKNNDNVEVVFIENNKHRDLIDLCKQNQIKVEIKAKSKLDQLTNKASHQGVVAKVMEYQYYQINDIIKESEYPLIVLLDGVEDPHNFGAIIRTCEAVGVDGIIILERRSVSVTGTVVKTSAGAIDNVKIVKVANLVRTIQELKDLGYWIVGTDLKNSVDYRSIDYKMKTVLVVGSEGKGMSRLVREACDFIAQIPMKGKVNSLNVSVATAIMLYEIYNQQNVV